MGRGEARAVPTLGGNSPSPPPTHTVGPAYPAAGSSKHSPAFPYAGSHGQHGSGCLGPLPAARTPGR